MQKDKNVIAASFLLVVGILGVLMFAMADESETHVGFQLVPEEDSSSEGVSDALTQVREAASKDFEDDETDFVQASSEWMWDRSAKARKKLGLGPKTAFKINPARRSKRERKMARTVVHEASSRARSKIGLVGNRLVSFRTVGLSKAESHPFSSLMKTADANRKFVKSRNAEALGAVKRIVAKLAQEMIRRAEGVKTPQLAFSQWMWSKKKSPALKRASRDPRDEMAHLHMYDLRKRRTRINRLAQKIFEEAEREQKVAFLKGDSTARAQGEMKLSMVNTASYVKQAKAHVRTQLKALIHRMSEAMINRVALEQHRTKTVKAAKAAVVKIKGRVVKREAKIARVKKALKKATNSAVKKALRKKLIRHYKKLHKLKKAHKTQVRRIATFHAKKVASKAHALARSAKKMAGVKSKKGKKAKLSAKSSRKAYKAAVAKAIGKKEDPGDAWGEKKKVTARADCLQDGAKIACASEKIKH